MRRILALGLVVLVPLAGCASYTARPVAIPKPDMMPLSRTEGSVVVRIDPYFDVQRQKAAFDKNLSDEHVLAVQVHAENGGPGRVVLRPSEMALQFPDGLNLMASSAAMVAMKVSGGAGGVIGSGLAFGGIGFAAAWHAKEKAKAERVADYAGKELQDVTLRQGESTHGFVFFIGSAKSTFRDGTLVIRIVEAEAATTRVVRLPLAETKSSGIPKGR